jgi:hypothetical protein
MPTNSRFFIITPNPPYTYLHYDAKRVTEAKNLKEMIKNARSEEGYYFKPEKLGARLFNKTQVKIILTYLRRKGIDCKRKVAN